MQLPIWEHFRHSKKDSLCPLTVTPHFPQNSSALGNHFCLCFVSIPDISFKGNHVTCGAFRLAFFTQSNHSKVSPCCGMSQYSVPFHCQMIFHCKEYWLHILSVHSSTKRHLSCFYFSNILNSAPMTIHIPSLGNSVTVQAWWSALICTYMV